MGIPKAAAIVICKNSESFPEACVASVLAQTCGDCELLLLSDSTDTVRILEALDRISPHARHQVRIIPFTKPWVTGEVLNGAINDTQSPWLLWLNGRECISRDMLDQCLTFTRQNPTVSVIYPDKLNASGSQEFHLSPEFDFSTLVSGQWIPECTFFSKRAWQDVGGFRTNVEGFEAWDFWMACGSRGLEFKRIPKPLVYGSAEIPEYFSTNKPDFEIRIAQVKINNRECFSHEQTQAAEGVLGRVSSNGGMHAFNPARIPMVTVVIPTFNRTDTLKIALASVQAQTFRDFEIVIVSDCGSNELEALVTAANLRQNITYVRHGANRGLGASRNTGIGATRGKYIAYLDDDDFFYPNHLERLVGYLEKTGEKVVYTDAHRIFQKKVNGVYVEDRRDAPYSHDFDYNVILLHNFIPVLCLLHARECIREVGGFDESLGTHEDWDLWIRMSRKYTMNHITEITSAFTHREDGTNMSTRRKLSFLDTTVAIYAKYPEFVRDLPDVRAQQTNRVSQMRAELGIPVIVPLTRAHIQANERLKSGDEAGAIQAFSEWVATGEKDARAFHDFALLLAKVGRPTEAEAHFRNALLADSGNVKAIRDYGDFCFNQGKIKEAFELLKFALKLNPRDLDTSMSIGKLSESIGQIEVALEFYRNILAIDPTYQPALERIERRAGFNAV